MLQRYKFILRLFKNCDYFTHLPSKNFSMRDAFFFPTQLRSDAATQLHKVVSTQLHRKREEFYIIIYNIL